MHRFTAYALLIGLGFMANVLIYQDRVIEEQRLELISCFETMAARRPIVVLTPACPPDWLPPTAPAPPATWTIEAIPDDPPVRHAPVWDECNFFPTWTDPAVCRGRA